MSIEFKVTIEHIIISAKRLGIDIDSVKAESLLEELDIKAITNSFLDAEPFDNDEDWMDKKLNIKTQEQNNAAIEEIVLQLQENTYFMNLKY